MVKNEGKEKERAGREDSRGRKLTAGRLLGCQAL